MIQEQRTRGLTHGAAGICCTVAAGWWILAGVSAQAPAKWSVPARVFPADEAAARPEPAARVLRQPAPASNALPPQYETTRRHSSADEAAAHDGTLRFLVSLVKRPILVEAQVTIDGRPFRLLREDRINRLMSDLALPDPGLAAASPSGAEGAADPSADAVRPGAGPESPLLARLRRYAAATGRSPTRDELRWLLRNWLVGPTLLLLDENYQRVRADASPLFRILDLDQNRVLSADEMALAARSLWAHDTNQDEVLTWQEIKRAAGPASRGSDAPPAIPPLIPLERLAGSQTLRRLRDHYASATLSVDPDGDEVVSLAELESLSKSPPDLLVRVTFHTRDPRQSRVEVMAGDASRAEGEPAVRETSLTFFTGGSLFELSAVQSQGVADTDQISLGAVRDGYPLLPEIDANEDGKLSVREVRDVSERLKAFDHDRDGRVAEADLPATLRVSLGLGPIVHRQLAAVRSFRPSAPVPELASPEWFARMDRNQDGDLTPREFLGGQAKFAALDADQDGLISTAEAAARKP